jgi:hypothetical protein
MRSRPWILAGGAAGLVVVVVAVVLAIVLTDGGDGKGTAGAARQATTLQLSHAAYARLWQRTRVGEPTKAVLARWPKTPYQHYGDNLKDDCFEWFDKPNFLYNLCFKGGVLRTKSLF